MARRRPASPSSSRPAFSSNVKASALACGAPRWSRATCRVDGRLPGPFEVEDDGVLMRRIDQARRRSRVLIRDAAQAAFDDCGLVQQDVIHQRRPCMRLRPACDPRKSVRTQRGLPLEGPNPLRVSREETDARRHDFLGMDEMSLRVQHREIHRPPRHAFEPCDRREKLGGRECPARREEKGEVEVAVRAGPPSRHGPEQVDRFCVGHAAAGSLHDCVLEIAVENRSGERHVSHDTILTGRLGLVRCVQTG